MLHPWCGAFSAAAGPAPAVPGRCAAGCASERVPHCRGHHRLRGRCSQQTWPLSAAPTMRPLALTADWKGGRTAFDLCVSHT